MQFTTRALHFTPSHRYILDPIFYYHDNCYEKEISLYHCHLPSNGDIAVEVAASSMEWTSRYWVNILRLQNYCLISLNTPWDNMTPFPHNIVISIIVNDSQLVFFAMTVTRSMQFFVQ